MGHIRIVAPSLAKISDCKKMQRASKRCGLVRRARPQLPLCRRNSLTTSSQVRLLPVRNRCNVTSQPIKLGITKKSLLAKKSSVVQFNDEVSVFLIQSLRDYPKRTLKCLYQTKKERKENLKRNRLEFLADGKDWRKVLEEDSMLVDENGEHFHPVHSVGLSAFVKKRKVKEQRIRRISSDSIADSE